MTVKRIKAAPGVGLSIIKTEKFKSDFFTLKIYVPLERRTAAEVSLLSRVMMRGTAKHGTIGELSRYTDMLYNLSFSAGVSANGSMQVLSFRMDFLDDRFVPKQESVDVLASAMDFLREFFCEPLLEGEAFSASYTESEKKQLLDRIRGEINNKNAYAFKRCRSLMLGDRAAAIDPDGDEETVAAITPEMLYCRFRKLLGECHAEALYGGYADDAAEEKLIAALSEIFAADRPDTPLPENIPFLPEEGGVRTVTEETHAKQGRLILGYSFPYSGEESARAAIFNEIFGGSPISRLFMNVRERLSLCYYCSASPDLALGALWVRSGVSEENRAAAETEIARQLADIAAGNVTDEELEIAKRSFIGAQKTLLDSPGVLGEWYLRRFAIGAPTDAERLIADAEAVTVKDVAEMAGRVKLCLGYYLRGID